MTHSSEWKGIEDINDKRNMDNRAKLRIRRCEHFDRYDIHRDRVDVEL